jgi:hypothetical protein
VFITQQTLRMYYKKAGIRYVKAEYAKFAK